MKNYKLQHSVARGILVLGSSLPLLLGLVGCNDHPAQPTEDGVESASLFLSTTVVPSDVRCIVLNVAAVGSTATRSFDVTPSQSTSLTATGLPTGSATLTEGAYNAACSQVTAQTPLTWVSDAAVVVQLGAGQTTSVSIVLRRAGGAAISTIFADNVDAGSPVNNPPVIAAVASASPNPIAGSTTTLSVLGADDGGEAALTYTWATTGPASVSFSANGTNAAKNTTASFTAAGTYSFVVTVKDQGNLTVTSAVNPTVIQTLTSIVVTPASATVLASATQQFTATARDQFATSMASQPGFAWTVSGGGSVSAGGLFTAGTSAGGPFTIQASSGGLTGAATITVGSAPAPVAVYRIDTGSNSAVAPFSADTYATGGTMNAVSNTISTTGVANAAPAAVYQSERYGNSTYTLPSLVASTQYTVRLHFAEIYWSATGKRLFNVLVNGATVLSNFDIFAVAGAQYKAVVRDFTASANSSGQIVIQFNTVTDNATIEGIEVLSACGTCPTGQTCNPSSRQCECSAGTPCGSGCCDTSTNYCAGNTTCTPKPTSGQSCSGSIPCASGLNCSNGYCCAGSQTGCNGQCCGSSSPKCISGVCRQCGVSSDCSAPNFSCVANTCICRQPSAGNLLTNSGFDSSNAVLAWQSQIFSNLDADGCNSSGSVSLPVGGQGISQCYPLPQPSSNIKYFIGAKYYGSAPYCLGNFYSDPACLTPILSPAYIGTSVTSPASSSSWGAISGSWPTDSGTQGIFVQCQGSGSYIDQIYLNAITETGF